MDVLQSVERAGLENRFGRFRPTRVRDELVGVSLINGRVGSCSPTYCGVRKLTLAKAIEIRGTWAPAHLIEWARNQDVPLRMLSDTLPADRVQPGQAGLPTEQLRHILDRLDRGA